MEEDKQFDLRDRFALEAMHVLINAFNATKLKNGNYGLYEYFISGKNKDVIKETLSYNDQDMACIAQVSYRIADILRKARLVVFE